MSLTNTARINLATIGGSLVGLSLAAAPAGAATLFADNFDDLTAGASLNARTPQTSFNGSTWVAPTEVIVANGAGGISGNSASNRSALLDLGAGYLSTNKGVYDLSADLTQPSGVNTAGWIALGFAQGVSGVRDAGNNMVGNNGAPWLIFRLNGGEVVFGGTGATNTLLATGTGAAGITLDAPHNFRLQLDTTGTQWTLNAFLDNVQQDLNGAAAGNTYTFTSNPTNSRYVGISTGVNGTGGIGTFDNFNLTGPVAVPEPGTFALAAGGVSLLATRRRRGA